MKVLVLFLGLIGCTTLTKTDVGDCYSNLKESSQDRNTTGWAVFKIIDGNTYTLVDGTTLDTYTFQVWWSDDKGWRGRYVEIASQKEIEKHMHKVECPSADFIWHYPSQK